MLEDKLEGKGEGWQPPFQKTEECSHTKCNPPFDYDEAMEMSSQEVRKKYPRFFGECPDCGDKVIGYASFAHYISGDW